MPHDFELGTQTSKFHLQLHGPIFMGGTSWHMCEEFTRAQVSDEVVQALRMDRMTALQKSSGGIRGIVVGDFVRRVVARTLAQRRIQPNPGANVSCTLPRHSQIWTLLSVDGIGVVGGGRRRFRSSLCPSVLQFPIDLLVGRRRGSHSRNRAREGAGATGPLDASLMRTGAT